MSQDVVSTKTLVKASIAAMLIAGIVFVCVILPAEYNIDPTHIGHKLGLTLLAPQAEKNLSNAAPTLPTKQGQHVIEIKVPAGKGVEYKFQMQQYEKITYEWLTDGELLYFDLHGEPQGDTTGYFESYAIATLQEMKGSFTAPFAGSHGWYWRNNGNSAVAVQLIVEGQYKVIGLKH